MGNNFFETPILNSPYEEPRLHHELDENGQPTQLPPSEGRRPSSYLSPVPASRKKKEGQYELALLGKESVLVGGQMYDPSPTINDLRLELRKWRLNSSPKNWGVTPLTVNLLRHWRSDKFREMRPFFCQLEAVETIIWLTEVVSRRSSGFKEGKNIWDKLKMSNNGANPELLRLAMKMATGAGKTTVMAMLIAWQTINAVRSPLSKKFTRGFLIITPGITIKDRLRVLQPYDPDNYYEHRELVPKEMLSDVKKARMVITNYHSLQRRDKLGVNKTTRSFLQGRGSVQSVETEGEMVCRVAGELMGMKNIVVINDEAHHCYREKPDGEDEDLKGSAKKEAEENNKAARLWINGIEAFKRKIGVRIVYDLSATPFFLSGSGWTEGTLFPWTVSDFSLMDAIESGIVKLPRVPVDDNIPGEEMPIFRNLWEHIGKDMPKKGGLTGDPHAIPDKLKSALNSLYGHYEKGFKIWDREGIKVPPVFIVVCNNTTTSKLVYEWISGWQRQNDDGELETKHFGHLELFRNFDECGELLARPNTLLIDSKQIESGDKLSDDFRKMASSELEIFKRERKERGEEGDVSDSELLREVMNTVGKKDRLGEGIRCVVSVSMLTEGWDANTVTHILGIRAFGTQLLCEQVVGRSLRRLSYDLDENGLFESEYADILGIPFDFASRAVVSDTKPPKKKTNVRALKEREGLEIRFPRVKGYRYDLPEERLEAEFTEDSSYVIDHEKIGASKTDMAGLVGKEHTLSLGKAKDMRESSISYHLAKEMMGLYFVDKNGDMKVHLFGQIKRICRRWLDEGYLRCPGGTASWMLCEYPEIASQACERISMAIRRTMKGDCGVRAVLDLYSPEGSTGHVNFQTIKAVKETSAKRCHVNYVVLDSDWESEFARVVENHPRVISYVKNQGLDFVVPYRDGDVSRKYIPDFIVCVDDGYGVEDPLHVIVEIKGFKDGRVGLKKETVREKWLPSVNRMERYGRWTFEQFELMFEIDREFEEMVDRLIAGREKDENG